MIYTAAARMMFACLLTVPAGSANAAGADLVRMDLVEPAYRASIFSTQPTKRIVARLTHFDPPLQRVLAKVKVTLFSPTGKALAEQVVDEVGQEATFDASALAPGRYAVSYGTSAGGTIEQSLIVTVLPPARNEVYLDAGGVCMVNGERFFPLGLYHVGDNLWMLQKDNEKAGEPLLSEEDIFRSVAEKGFNTVVTMTNQEEFLDLATKYNMRVLQFVSMGGGPAERSVREQKAHPALLGWTLNDEPQLNVIVKYNLLDRFIQCRHFDPYHPVWVAQHSDFVHGVFTYDILTAEHYHFDALTIGKRGRLSVLGGSESRIERARQAIRPGQAVWLVTPTMGGAVYLVPSLPEFRSRIYQGIVGGARGVLVFTYTYGEVMEDGIHWRIDRHGPKVWHDYGKLNAELRDLMPVLTAPGGETNLSAQGAPNVRWLKREHDGRLYAIVVNVGTKPQRFELQLPVKWTRASVRWEQRTVELKEGRLKDWIDLFGVRVYEVE